MSWLGLVFIWFGATALRGQRDRFAFGALVAAFAVVTALDVLNPDDLIVRVNAAHTTATRPFDGLYAGSLSADAVPALLEVIPNKQGDQIGELARGLILRWTPSPGADWRSWNWSRSRASQSVALEGAVLRRWRGTKGRRSGWSVSAPRTRSTGGKEPVTGDEYCDKIAQAPHQRR